MVLIFAFCVACGSPVSRLPHAHTVTVEKGRYGEGRMHDHDRHMHHTDDEPLRQAAAKGKTNEVKALLADGYSPNGPGRLRWTALHFAARYGHAEVVSALLQAGADVNLKGIDGRTAEDMARDNKHSDVSAAFSAKQEL